MKVLKYMVVIFGVSLDLNQNFLACSRFGPRARASSTRMSTSSTSGSARPLGSFRFLVHEIIVAAGGSGCMAF